MKNLGKIEIIFFCSIFFVFVKVLADDTVLSEPKTDFRAIDSDKNGAITLREMRNYQRNKFDELDKDKNGALDQNELKSGKDGIFKEADKNNDGKVTRQEADLKIREYFLNLDTNRNMRVSEQEYTDYWKLKVKF